MSSLDKEISEISTLRETKGKEKETLLMIDNVLPQVINSNEWKSLAKLYWESHLVWQHTIMTEQAKSSEIRNNAAMKLGIEKMMEFAQKAKEVIEKHDLDDMLGGAYRFLGRASTFSGDHINAKNYYEIAISKYTGKNLKSKLEVSGFLAEALVRLGKPEEGLALAVKTYDDFLNTEIGKNLKKEDYTTWAIWMSGVAPRLISALLDTGADFDKERIKIWLTQIEKELESPSSPVTWGDPKFGFRRNEINSALEKIISLSFVLIGTFINVLK